MRGERLAELLVGDAEHGAVADTLQRKQACLDLGGVDVHAAADHHVAAPIVEIEVAVGVEIADVAAADEAVALDRTALLLVAGVGEVGPDVEPHVDLARLAGRELAPVGVEDLDHGLLDRPADGARVREPLLAGAVHDRPRLGAAVVLGDDRAQPLDHRALDVGRTRRGGVNDPAQRGEVIARAHLARAAPAAARTSSGPSARR